MDLTARIQEIADALPKQGAHHAKLALANLKSDVTEEFDHNRIPDRYVGWTCVSGSSYRCGPYRFWYHNMIDCTITGTNNYIWKVGPTPKTWHHFEVLCEMAGINLKRK